ncbi:HSP20-like chaperone [Gorgonomyces haynaldii]|nr:HSP20-like chaperone [Gorgonomyces haynaldii]
MSLINRILSPARRATQLHPVSSVFSDPFFRDPFFRDPFTHFARDPWVAESRIPIDYAENEKEYVVEATVPGFSQEHLSIDLAGNTLTVKGEQKEEDQKTNRLASFEQAITLPKEVDPTQVKASLKNGILSITLPKREVDSHKISISDQ